MGVDPCGNPVERLAPLPGPGASVGKRERPGSPGGEVGDFLGEAVDDVGGGAEKVGGRVRVGKGVSECVRSLTELERELGPGEGGRGQRLGGREGVGLQARTVDVLLGAEVGAAVACAEERGAEGGHDRRVPVGKPGHVVGFARAPSAAERVEFRRLERGPVRVPTHDGGYRRMGSLTGLWGTVAGWRGVLV